MALIFKKEFLDLIVKQQKTQTIRIKPFRFKPIVGRIITATNYHKSYRVEITGYKTTFFKALSLDDIKKDGFAHKTDLYAVLKSFYPEFTDTTLLYVLEFKLKTPSF